ncbi:Fc receptor-like protein 5 isoform X5 [Dicentrarchus labrax]|uniref:Fc receptor-like protein 5 isoform X5 n=1 Tax=Dicentrarchus labrax TaxID=13489 RepID=UPI0021F64D78|nr:Fc receptor-like protein 5 isoform X5 [Dicentrarchus labrax]
MEHSLLRDLLFVLAGSELFRYFLHYIVGGGSLSLRPVLTGPDMAYLGSRVVFRCIAPDSSPPITYELMGDSGDLIFTDTDIQGDQSVPFYLKVTATSEGSYHCKATAGGSTGVSNSIKLSVVTPALNTRVTSEPFPPVAYEGSHIVLSCNVTRGSHLSYTWFFNRKEITSPTSPFFHLTGNKVVMEEVTPEHAGYYYCMAWSSVQDIRRFSSSAEVQVTVKAYVSKPRVSYSISKEGASYHGNVTCWSTRGSPPVNISLLLDDKEMRSVTASESVAAWFPVDIVPGLDMGVARCKINTEVQELISEPVTLEVVPVGGEVKVEVEYLFRADSRLVAARLNCQISRGTFPFVSWLLNDSVLEDSRIQPLLSHYTLADHRRTLFLATLHPEEFGYYRCRVRDSYDDSGPWVESAAELVRVPEVFIATIEVITIAFCCFLFLMLAVGVGCVYKMFDHKQARAHITTTNPSSDARPMSAPTSQSGAKQADTSSVDCDDLYQVYRPAEHITTLHINTTLSY